MGKPRFKRGDAVSIIGYPIKAKVSDNPFVKNETWYYRLNIGTTCAEEILTQPEATTSVHTKRA